MKAKEILDIMDHWEDWLDYCIGLITTEDEKINNLVNLRKADRSSTVPYFIEYLKIKGFEIND